MVTLLANLCSSNGAGMREPPVFAKQRGAICEAVLMALRAYSMAYFGDDKIGDHCPELIIGCAIMVGQSAGKPLTASDIAGFTGFPRSTVVRHLNKMEAAGRVVFTREGNRMPAWIAKPNDPQVISEIVKLFDRAAKLSTELSKMDDEGLASKRSAR